MIHIINFSFFFQLFFFFYHKFQLQKKIKKHQLEFDPEYLTLHESEKKSFESSSQQN